MADFESIRSQIEVLRGILNEEENSNVNSDDLLRDCLSEFQKKVKQILNEDFDTGNLPDEEYDKLSQHLKEELCTLEAENSKISCEIEGLKEKILEDSSQLESVLEAKSYYLDLIESQGLDGEKVIASVDSFTRNESPLTLINGNQKFKIMELEDQKEEKKSILKTLQDLDSKFRRLDAIEQLDEEWLKINEIDGKHINLSLPICIPKLERFCRESNEDMIACSKLNYELLIEICDGTMEIQSAKIIPNDVYIDDIVEASKSCRQHSSILGTSEPRSLLTWFISELRERIILCTIRRLLVNNANKSRWHSVEYLNRDEIIVAHMVGGVDALIKISSGWPISNSPLSLISLKSTDQQLNSLSFFCRVEEAVNCLDVHVRQDLSSFIDAVEKILVKQMRQELHSDGTHGK